jgi:hypothetical protein
MDPLTIAYKNNQKSSPLSSHQMERKRLLIQNLNSNLSDRGVRRVKIAGLLLMVAVKDLIAELLVEVETLHKA